MSICQGNMLVLTNIFISCYCCNVPTASASIYRVYTPDYIVYIDATLCVDTYLNFTAIVDTDSDLPVSLLDVSSTDTCASSRPRCFPIRTNDLLTGPLSKRNSYVYQSTSDGNQVFNLPLIWDYFNSQ